MLSDWDITNIEQILMGEGDWFTAKLLRLISTCDIENRELLRKSYPKEVALYEAWYYKDSEHPMPVAD